MMTGQVAVADETGALVNFGALMVGLYYKKLTGQGQKIDTSLLGSQIRLMGFSMTRVLFFNEEIERSRARISGGEVPAITASFNDKNGRGFAIQMVGEESWQKGMAAAGFSKRLAEVGVPNSEMLRNPRRRHGSSWTPWIASLSLIPVSIG